MKNEDYELLTESLQQAIDYKQGNKKAARSTVLAIDVQDYNAADVVAVRRKLNLTQQGLANVVGVSTRTVEAWEAGRNKPNGSARHLLYLLGKDERILSLLKA